MKTRPTLQEHQSLGDELYSLNRSLWEHQGTLQNHYGKSSDIFKAAKAAADAMQKLRDLLDDQVGIDLPGESSETLSKLYLNRG